MTYTSLEAAIFCVKGLIVRRCLEEEVLVPDIVLLQHKINRFADKERHQLFIEPEGWKM
jgi:hypothetical protein